MENKYRLFHQIIKTNLQDNQINHVLRFLLQTKGMLIFNPDFIATAVVLHLT